MPITPFFYFSENFIDTARINKPAFALQFKPLLIAGTGVNLSG